ncbi:hypothetical protein ACQKNB_12865, partial [Lysinibacillus xylanilyticus]|uniref:hypothetical protein n=1 Tax=Lysinibacillus xylanilyticus TaxID=582475 RepID=UPI003CFE9A4B
TAFSAARAVRFAAKTAFSAAKAVRFAAKTAFSAARAVRFAAKTAFSAAKAVRFAAKTAFSVYFAEMEINPRYGDEPTNYSLKIMPDTKLLAKQQKAYHRS